MFLLWFGRAILVFGSFYILLVLYYLILWICQRKSAGVTPVCREGSSESSGGDMVALTIPLPPEATSTTLYTGAGYSYYDEGSDHLDAPPPIAPAWTPDGARSLLRDIAQMPEEAIGSPEFLDKCRQLRYGSFHLDPYWYQHEVIQEQEPVLKPIEGRARQDILDVLDHTKF